MEFLLALRSTAGVAKKDRDMKEISMAKAYDPAEVEEKWYKVWVEQGYFHASATTPKTPFSIAIPPPKVRVAAPPKHRSSISGRLRLQDRKSVV